MIRWIPLLAVAAVAAAAAPGCGDGDGAPAAAPARAAPPAAPPRVRSACEEVAATNDLLIRCPARLPVSGAGGTLKLRVAHLDFATDRCAYLIDFEGPRGTTNRPFHVLVGGAPGYALDVSDGRWPRAFPKEDPLRLIPVEPLEPGETTSNRLRVPVVRDPPGPLLVVEMPPYPSGGVHGGHLVGLARRGADTYVVSLHFQDRSDRTRSIDGVEAALRSLRRVGDAGARRC